MNVFLKLLLFLMSSAVGFALMNFVLFLYFYFGFDPDIPDAQIDKFKYIFIAGTYCSLIVSSIFSTLFLLKPQSPYRYAYLTLPLYIPSIYSVLVALYYI